MSRVAPLLLLVLAARSAPGADLPPGPLVRQPPRAPIPLPNPSTDLPPGALARLGDDRFRAGGAVSHLALSPDGRRYATACCAAEETLALTVWDSATGRPVCEQRVNRELFRGFVWGSGGAFAIAACTEPASKDKRGKLVPNDFCVWDFTDPAAAPPLLPRLEIEERRGGPTGGDPPKPAPEYTNFLFSADGNRVAAEWESGGGTFAVHVFDLKPTATAAALTRAGTVDLGADHVDAVRVAARGDTLVTVRALAGCDRDETEFAATVWDVARGKRERLPFRVRTMQSVPPILRRYLAGPEYVSHQLILAPHACSVYVVAEGEKEWGFDEVPLVRPGKIPQPKRRSVIRWPNEPDASERSFVHSYHSSTFSPNGNTLVIGARGKTLVIDLVSGKQLGRLEGHADEPSAIAVSADGTRIATADVYGLVRLWDAKTFRPLHDAPGHRAPVKHAELSPDGQRLLTWAPDETVRLWDVVTGKELRAFTGVPNLQTERPEGNWPTFTPDGTAIVFATKERLVARDLLTGLEIPLSGALAKAKVRQAVFAPDGKSVLVWPDDAPGAVYDWPNGGKRFDVGQDESVRPAGFSSDGTAVIANASEPKRWSATTGRELPAAWLGYRGNDAYPLLALRPTSLLLHAPQSKEVCVIEAGRGESVPRFRLTLDERNEHLISHIALSPRGGHFATTRGWRDEADVLLCEAATGQVRRTLAGHRGAVRVLGFTPDGTKLLTAGGDHTVLVWDVRLQAVPLPNAVKQETSASKLWSLLATGNAKDAYLAMSRLAREPDAAVKMAKMRLPPAAKPDSGAVADARAIELLDALDTDDARALLKELAGGPADAFRTQEAKRAQERNKAVTGATPR